MNNTKFNNIQNSIPSGYRRAFLGQAVGKIMAVIWRWGNDRLVIASFVGRYSAHVAILTLALLMGFVGHFALTPFSVINSSVDASNTNPSIFGANFQPVIAEMVAPPTFVPSNLSYSRQLSIEMYQAVFRHALPRTNIPERVRLEVITYTIQSGDNIFWIAEKFELSPYTIVWSNMEILQGAPWLLANGLTLYIPPVDGAYHTVVAGETVQGIAEQYEVAETILYNQWNDVAKGIPLREGTLLIIPDGVGEDFDWDPPPPLPARPGVGTANASWGYCGDIAVSGPGATGWFILPTGSTLVSGWYFHDSRNPTHGGLDYKCHLGDPIYAADSGVVIFAGWGGGYGNLVRVRHGNGYETYYAHFNSFAIGCGEPVYQGQLLGYCGTTGWSTGPHLHYEIRLNGVPQNPQLFE